MSNSSFAIIMVLVLQYFLMADSMAQVPAGIPYQAVARDASGNLLVSQLVGIRFSILSDNPASGTVHYREVHTVTTTDLGQINISIGSGTVVSGVFNSIPWSDPQVRLQVEMDPSGGTSYTVSGVTVFGSVPYAFRSGSSSLSGNGVPSGTFAGQTLRWDGSSWVTASNLINNGSNVSINPGTSSPDLALTLGDNLSQDGGIVAKGKYGTGGSTLNTTGDGVRLIWYPKKAAFRAGYAIANGWNDSQIGFYSWAGGYSTVASGMSSFSFGYGTSASGDFSVAMGSGNVVSGESSAAFGAGNQVAGYWSFAAGQGNVVSNSWSTAFGYSNTVSATYSITSGWGNKVSGDYATALGFYNSAKGAFSFSGGSESSARGSRSLAFGQGVIARSWSEIALGSFNTDYTPQDSTTFNSNDRIFVIGNGNYSGRKNALVILKNGNLGIGEDIPSETFVIGSGGKFRIDSLGNVKRINNVAYSWPAVQGNNNQFLKNDGAGNLSWAPVAASASDITSGTLDDARLSANIFRLNATQTVSANHSFQDGTLRLWNAVSSFPTILSAPSATISRTLTFPDASGTVITTGNLGQITGTGAITSGTWMGSTIGPQYGGTGLNTAAALAGSIFYTNTVGSWAVLGPGTNGQILSMVSGIPTWKTDASAGTVTSIATGSGLTGGPITGSGTISIDNTVVPRLTTANTFAGTITAPSFVGNGSGLTNLSVPASGITGTLSSSILPSTVAYQNSSNVFTQNQSIFGSASTQSVLRIVAAPGQTSTLTSWFDATGSGNPVASLESNGTLFTRAIQTEYGNFTSSSGVVPLSIVAAAAQFDPLTEWRSSTGTVLASVTYNGIFTGNGSGLTNLSVPASGITGTMSSSSLPSTIAYQNSSNVFTQNQSILGSDPGQSVLKIISAPGQTSALTTWFDATGSGIPLAALENNGTLFTRRIQTENGNFTSSSGVVPLSIVAAAAQFDPLTVWRSSTGTILASVTYNGIFTGNGSGLTNVTASSSTPVGGDLSGTIGNAQLALGSVGTAEISDGSVSAADLSNGSVTTAKLADNSVSGAKLAMGSDALGDMLVYNGTDYVRLIAGSNGQILKMNAGVPTWSNPTGILSSIASLDGAATAPSSTLAFLSPTVSVTISNTSQRVLLDVSCALGAAAVAASGLNIYPAYKLNSATTVSAWGGGIIGLTCPVNTRQIYSVNASIVGLPAGTYQVGMAGTGTNFTNNDYCYVRSVVVN